MLPTLEDFDTLRRELGEIRDYSAIRQEVAGQCFSGDSTFTVAEAIAAGASVSHMPHPIPLVKHPTDRYVASSVAPVSTVLATRPISCLPQF